MNQVFALLPLSAKSSAILSMCHACFISANTILKTQTVDVQLGKWCPQSSTNYRGQRLWQLLCEEQIFVQIKSIVRIQCHFFNKKSNNFWRFIMYTIRLALASATTRSVFHGHTASIRNDN